MSIDTSINITANTESTATERAPNLSKQATVLPEHTTGYLNRAAADRPLVNPVSIDTHHKARRYRLQRVKEQLIKQDCAAVLLYDPVNIRYATDSSNMQVWTLHNFARYALVFAEGPVILWEFHNCEHLLEGNDLVDEIRTAVNWSYFGAGSRISEKAQQWANEITSVVKQYAGKGARLAVDKADLEGLEMLMVKGITLVEGHSLMEEARLIKSAEELELMRWTIRVCEQGIQRMHDELRPGMTENELWAWLHFENIRNGGEWIETRLLSSGPRTNPWMQEASDRVMQEGEIVSFDTDLIGPYGYCADISRAWTVGHVPPTDEQRRLYQLAYDQVQSNMGLLKAGLSFQEFSERAWPIPDAFYHNRYCCVVHGIGLADEFPAVAHQGSDWKSAGYNGHFEENMVVCVESYIGEQGGKEGIKLEQQVLITKEGCMPLSTYPWQEDWLR
ncbi:M24 family metallopeptidase [Oceanospirillum sediminis]|uniref:Aminopeptidase P family protein n=1 Tax=Oceanospirillum sediminis TaxID=2760088 RepID=A0A839IWP4_9GAMM|nr:Xaa-Pro peptidase family protein [Oceanospirillum sediminis]MBB1488506.1 aminopeptidase P family protein [Oceanospirillum sediminis]